MRSKEEVMLLWIVLIVTGLVVVMAYPPILFIGLVLYAAITLYNHYRYKN